MSESLRSDLAVDPISDTLQGWTLDVIVSGSIGAVESVRFIRALRRLGADVRPWLTAGGARFITEVALGWAAGRPAITAFSGDASHVATGDACIVAPASAHFVSQTSHGLTDTPASALVSSYLGANLPVMMVPNMHTSLAEAPAYRQNVDTLQAHGVEFLSSREEEGKKKFPDPAWLADQVAHSLRFKDRIGKNPPRVLVSMGTTRGYLDDVRYISNYSSGALGSLVAEELYRHGIQTDVVAGPCPITPRSFWRLTSVETNDDMGKACDESLKSGAQAAILAASVLDFAPATKAPGKIKSRDHATLTVDLTRQPKLIAAIHPPSGLKVGFKLEADLSQDKAASLAAHYMPEYGLSLMVINALSDVDQKRHKAWVFHRNAKKDTISPAELLETKAALAKYIVNHIISQLP